jgi:predicted ATP-grasp superfamily ATP-dependent carboligase
MFKARRSSAATDVGAIVIGGDYRGLGVVRSLGRRGIPVWVLTEDHMVAAVSRYCRRHVRLPSGKNYEKLDALIDLASHGARGWVLFPTGDETASLVSHCCDVLGEHFQLTTPPWQVLRWAYDKRLTNYLAEVVGVPIPRTFTVDGMDQLRRLDLRFPLILKPAIKTSSNALTHAKAWRVDDSVSLERRFQDASALVNSSIIQIQELIPGGGEAQFSYAALCEDGVPLVELTARRLRQFPIEFGRASSFVEIVECPDVASLSRRLLAEIGYTGLIEVEFKRDFRDNQYKLLDLNPRVWGWHTLAIRAGVDFPFLAFEQAQGHGILPTKARLGTRWARLHTDVLAAFQEMRQGKFNISGYARSIRPPLELSTFARDDPLPSLAELPLSALVAFQRRRF